MVKIGAELPKLSPKRN